LIHNDKALIIPCLQSIKYLGPIIIGNLGSNDGTLQICRQFGAEIYDVPAIRPHKTLAEHSTTDWNFFIHPWEVLACGQEEIKEKKVNSYIQIFQNDTISREIRLWNKEIKFHNPIFESLAAPNPEFLETACLYSKQHSVNYKELIIVIEKWKSSQPTVAEPYYYHACLLLNQGKYEDFLSVVDNYLFRKQDGIATVNLKYYAALIYLNLNNLNKAIYHVIGCIAVKPLMAEYWCLLGDIHYRANEYKKAMAFYENAIVLGSKRPGLDEWPVEISKYKEYPNKMINSCKDMLNNSKDKGIYNVKG